MAALHVHGVGLACPVGLTATSACAAIRARVDQRFEMDYLDNAGEPIVGSFSERLGWERTRRQRWLVLLAYALGDLGRTHGMELLGQVPILLAAPFDTQGTVPAPAELARSLGKLLAMPFDPRQIRVLTRGSLGGLWAIGEVREWLRKQGEQRVVVAGADSFIEARILARLARERRLLTSDNADGFIPGEAAACILLGMSGRDSLAAITGLGFGEEPGRLDNDIPLRGEGIATAARQALAEAGLGLHDMHFRLSDATGEAYWFKEQVLVVSKLLRQNMDAFPLWLSASILGHVGCAAALVNIIMAIRAWERGYAPGPRAIVFGSNDVGERAALVLDRGRA